MSDIFISYARPTAVQAQQIADALRALGYGVWLDDDLPVHRAYARVIPEQLTAAKAVVVLWSTAAIASQWVASEANRARSDHKLVQLSLDGEPLPMPFDQIQCADMNGWNGDINAPGWRRVVASIDELVRGASTVAGLVAPVAAGASVSTKPLPVAATAAAPAAATGPRRRIFIGALLGIAVLGGAASSYLLLRKSDHSPAPATTAAPGAATVSLQAAGIAPGFSNRPAIAVLPFENLSTDPTQAIFADGLAEGLIARLSTWRAFPVIGRGSSFHYRGDVDIKRVAKELNVRYVVQGSVRRAADRIRISAALVDAQSGESVWTQTYDRQVADVFALQDEISAAIAAPLVGDLERAEGLRAQQRGTRNLEAWSQYQLGVQTWNGVTAQRNAAAMALFRQALALEPQFATAQAWLAFTQIWHVVYGTRTSPAQDLAVAMASARRAVQLDPREPLGHVAFSLALNMLGDTHNALDEAQHTVDLNPSSPLGWSQLGYARLMAGDPKGAVAMSEQALRLDPQGIWVPLITETISEANWELAQYEDALAAARRTVTGLPGYYFGYVATAVSAVALGRLGEARAAIVAGRRVQPNLSLAMIQQGFGVSRPAVDARRNAALRQAGLQ